METTKLTKTEYYQQWKKNNPEKLKQSKKTWYENHKNTDEYKQKRREYQREYYHLKKTIELSKIDN
jgi:hypothetical protein